jgi:hypothetical protein
MDGTNAVLQAYDRTANAFIPIYISSSQTIIPTGNVLIGTTTDAGFKLDVNGTGRFSGNLTGTTASFTSSSTLLTLTSGAGTKAVFATTRNFGVNRNFQIAVDEFSESAFTITPSTTLGGSTYTTPIFTLAAAGAATFSTSVAASSFTSQGGRGTGFGFRLPDWQIYNTSSGNGFAINNYSNDVLTLASTGAATFSSSVTAVAFTASNGGDFAWGDGSTYIDGDSSNQLIRAVVNNTERLRITSGGNTELYGNLSLRAAATGSTATHVPVFIADPAATTRSLLTRTLQDFKFDVGSFIAKGVRSNAGDYTRTLDSVNDYSLWQDNFDWLASYNQSKVIIEAQTTGNINSSNTADKQLTIGWGISSDTNFNGDDYCTVNVPLGTGAVDYNVIINGTITITSNSELKMVIRVQIASGNVIEQNVMRMANVTAAGAMLNAAKNIAFTGKMNVTGTHTWSQRQTYLRLN